MGQLINVNDTAANDSDKVYSAIKGSALENNEAARIISVRVQYTSTATVGNRQLELQVLDRDANIIYEKIAATTQAASLTYNYQFGANVADATSPDSNDDVSVSIPEELYIPPGGDLRIFDNAAVAAGADDMLIYYQLEYRGGVGG